MTSTAMRCPECGDPSELGRSCAFCEWSAQQDALADEADDRGER